MNNKINLQELTELLALKSGISRKDSESFLRALFALMEEALIEDRQIKIKDLGTFKLVRIEERESIDVRTGHRMVIPAHHKISFIPAVQLADSVNEPFALFEPVEVEDEQLKTVFPSPLSSPPVSEVPNLETTHQPEPPIQPIQSHRPQVVDSAFSMENVFHLSQDDLERIRTNREEENKIMKRRKLIFRVFFIAVLLGVLGAGIWYFWNTKETKKEQVLNMKTSYQLKAEDSIRHASDQLLEDSAKSTNRLYPIYKNTESSEEPKSTTGQQRVTVQTNVAPAPVASADTPKPTVTPPAATSSEMKNIKPETTKTNTVQSPPAQKEPVVKKEQSTQTVKPVEKQSVEPAKSQQSTTTSTVIPSEKTVTTVEPKNVAEPKQTTGVKTRKIRNGERLTLIALNEYGNKIFWVYIYQENKNHIPNFNDVPVGLEVVIPSAQKYGINSNDPASIAKAKSLEDEILKR